jgi:hypothetical protein
MSVFGVVVGEIWDLNGAQLVKAGTRVGGTRTARQSQTTTLRL